MLGYHRVNGTPLVLAAAALLCLAAYGPTLTQRAYLHDDSWIIAHNALLDAGPSGAERRIYESLSRDPGVADAIAHWRAFAKYAPADPDASSALEIARGLERSLYRSQ